MEREVNDVAFRLMQLVTHTCSKIARKTSAIEESKKIESSQSPPPQKKKTRLSWGA